MPDSGSGEAEPSPGNSDNRGQNLIVAETQPIESEHVPGTVLVGIAEGVTLDQVNDRLSRLDYVKTRSVSEEDVVLGFAKLELAEGVAVEEAIARLEATDFASAAQPDYVYHLLDTAEPDAGMLQAATPAGGFSATGQGLPAQVAAIDDPLQSDQWALDAIHAYEAWDYVKANGAITVAVLDTGVNMGHEDLAANLVAPYNAMNGSENVSDGNGHGTHVAGIVGAVANNGKGVAGVSYNAKVMPVKISNDGTSTTSDIAAGANHVVQYAQGHPEANVRVLNLSFGAENESGSVDQACLSALNAVRQAGILVVCAAGNYADRSPHDETGVVYPDGADRAYRCAPVDYAPSIVGVVNVARTGEGDSATYDRAKGSNFNMQSQATKDLAAPGDAIYSTLTGGGYGSLSGTSMAAPCVAGVAALVFAVDPSLKPAQVQQILRETATDINAAGFDLETGYGMVNAAEAVKKAGVPAISGPNALAKGSTAQLSVEYAFGAPSWEWSTSNPAVAAVSATGVVTGVGAGTATIRAAASSASASYDVSVYDPAISGEDTVEFGSSITLSVSPDNPANARWRWSSDSSTVAIGASTGVVAGLALGQANVTVNLASPAVEGATQTKAVTIVPANLSGATVTGVADQVYAGAETSLPDLKVTMPGYVRTIGNSYIATTVTLVEGTDYDVVYDLGGASGEATTTATVTVRGKGNYAGEVSREFKVGANTINDSQVIASQAEFTYTGDPITLENLKVTSADGEELAEGKDYTVSYEGNVNAGYAFVTITGTGKYVNSVTRYFKIYPVCITDAVLDESSVVDTVYTGTAAKQNPRLTYKGKELKEGVDYELGYSGDNVNADEDGAVTLLIAGGRSTWNDATLTYGGGNFYSTYQFNIFAWRYQLYGDYRTATFKIHPASLEGATVTVADQVYSGRALTPTPVVTVGGSSLPTSDYEVEGYSDNTNAGTARVSIRAKSANIVAGSTASGSFTINPASIASVELQPASYVSDGTQKTPGVVVKGVGDEPLVAGVDYTLDVPAGRTAAGLYTYVATGRGNYAGTARATLTIAAAPDSGNGGSGGSGDGNGGGSGDNGSGGGNGIGSGGGNGNGNGGNGGGNGNGGSDDPGNLAGYAGYAANKSGLTDLKGSEWYMQVGEGLGSFPGSSTLYIDYTLAKGLMSGYRDEDGVMRRFGPDEYLNRAQAATIMYRLANPGATDTTDPAAYARNESGLPDVKSSAYYTAAVNWCVAEGVITGYGSPGAYYAFGPDDRVTREQIATMIARFCTVYKGTPTASVSLSRFPDAGSISEFARSGVSYCVARGIMAGYKSTGAFGPQDHTTRCQMSKIIAVAARMLE